VPRDDDSDYPTRCVCNDGEVADVFELGLDLPSDDVETCRMVNAACTGETPLELAGSPECTPTLSSSSNACTLRMDCVEAATLQGVGTTVQTTTTAHCDLDAADSDGWTCTCDRLNADPIAVEAPDADSACLQATDACRQLTPVLKSEQRAVPPAW
jgi:hypothetical protein